ncbi:hypothetical protein YB2330_001897 [Saitoella coloradoensis]
MARHSENTRGRGAHSRGPQRGTTPFSDGNGNLEHALPEDLGESDVALESDSADDDESVRDETDDRYHDEENDEDEDNTTARVGNDTINILRQFQAVAGE